MQAPPLSILAITTALCGATYLAARAGVARNEHRLERLEELDARSAPPPSEPPDASPVEAALVELRARLAQLEAPSERSPRERRDERVARGPAPTEERAEHAGLAPATPDPGAREELLALLASVLGPDGSLRGSIEEQQRFFDLARGTRVVDELVRDLEAQVAADPADLAARMDLAQAYVAKLMTIPGGPEQGIWGARAEEQWAEVAERDPMCWAAHFALGNDYSYYPDFMDKTGAAIASLERALEIQRDMAPEPAHVQTYLSLARMLRRRGKLDQVRALLEAGLQRHPGDAQLAAAIAELEE